MCQGDYQHRRPIAWQLDCRGRRANKGLRHRLIRTTSCGAQQARHGVVTAWTNLWQWVNARHASCDSNVGRALRQVQVAAQCNNYFRNDLIKYNEFGDGENQIQKPLSVSAYYSRNNSSGND